MDASTLLQQCEKLTSTERSRRMVELGRGSTTNESAKEVINELFGKTLYEQHLALETCYGSRNIQIAMAALASSSSRLKRRAMSIIILLGTDQDILNALNIIPLHAQIQGFFRMGNLRSRRRRQAVIDTFLDRLEDWTAGDQSVYRQFLYLASKGAVEKHLPKIIDRYTAIDWARLGKHHPGVARDAILGWATRSAAEDYHLMTTINSLLTQWGNAKSEATIDMALVVVPELLERLSIPLSRLTSLQGLLRKRPREMVQLILETEDQVIVAYESKVLRALKIEDLLALQERYSVVKTHNFAKLDMDQRLAIYNMVKVGWRSKDGVFPMNVLLALRMNERVKEARRHLKLRTFEPEPWKRIPYIALLPWEESIGLQNEFIKSADADVRISALQAQIESVKYDTDHLDDAIALVLRAKNDQDPVREAMIRALMKIPASRWTDTHLIQLSQVFRHGLDAGDLSPSTIWNIHNLISEILPWNPNWAAEQFQTLAKERGDEYYVPAQFKANGVLPMKDTMIKIAEAMSPILTTLVKKNLPGSLLGLAQTFSKFTIYWTDLLNALERAFDEEIKIEADQTNSSVYRVNHGDQILTILKEHRPESYWNLIPQLVERRSTFAENTESVQHVHLYRQNLLNPYLTPGSGLYDLGKGILCGFTNGFHRWTPAQQEILAQNLIKEIDDPELDTYSKERNIELLGLLTFLDPKHLIRYANDKTPIINEAAMRALGRFDSDVGVQLLIEALQDERARIAIYALRSIFLRMTKSEVLSLLKQAPLKKVTVAKEVIRLIGEVENSEALQYLLVLEKTDLHRDVRIALLRALWTFLEFHDAWRVFESAAQSSCPAAAKAVCNNPKDGMSSTARRRFLELLLLLLHHPAAEVRMEALACVDCLPIQDTEEILVFRLNELIQSPIGKEVYRAASAFFKTYAKTQVPLIEIAFQRVLDDPQSLTTLFDSFMSVAGFNLGVAQYVAASALILETLKRSRLTISLRLCLIFNSPLATKERLPSLITDIIPDLHADALVEAKGYINRISKRPGWKPFINELEEMLAKNHDERARRLAVSLLVAGVDKNKGWSNEERDRLRTYVKDDSILVAQAAAFVFPPDPKIEFESDQEDEDVVMT